MYLIYPCSQCQHFKYWVNELLKQRVFVKVRFVSTPPSLDSTCETVLGTLRWNEKFKLNVLQFKYNVFMFIGESGKKCLDQVDNMNRSKINKSKNLQQKKKLQLENCVTWVWSPFFFQEHQRKHCYSKAYSHSYAQFSKTLMSYSRHLICSKRE